MEILDVMRVAENHRVPGFGRQRAMALLSQGLNTFEDILNHAKDKLVGILRNERRTDSLLDALAHAVGLGSNRFAKTHSLIAAQLKIEEILHSCTTALGNDYEISIVKLLNLETSWVVIHLDDGKRQNVPDILIKLKDLELLIECKTCTKKPLLINKEEAFAVLQKAVDFNPTVRRVTLGKPAFDEHSKAKAQASPAITLVEHTLFMEGMLRVLTNRITAIDFLNWLNEPGCAEFNRLPGNPTYAAGKHT